jgi:hypothetical protein
VLVRASSAFATNSGGGGEPSGKANLPRENRAALEALASG